MGASAYDEAVRRAQVLMDLNRYADAERELGRSLSMSPDNAAVLAMMAWCQLKQKRWRDAVDTARQGVAADPEEPHAFYTLAAILMDRNKLAHAHEAALTAVRLDPYDPDNYALLSAVYLNASRSAEALACAEAGLRIEAEHADCQQHRALALIALKRHGEAQKQVAESLRLNPDDHNAFATLGWTELQGKRSHSAFGAFREALRLNPQSAWAEAGLDASTRARDRHLHLIAGGVLLFAMLLAGSIALVTGSGDWGKLAVMIFLLGWSGMLWLSVTGKTIRRVFTCWYLVNVWLTLAAFLLALLLPAIATPAWGICLVSMIGLIMLGHYDISAP